MTTTVSTPPAASNPHAHTKLRIQIDVPLPDEEFQRSESILALRDLKTDLTSRLGETFPGAVVSHEIVPPSRTPRAKPVAKASDAVA
ncbi:MAG: hypothetical protein PHZ23_15190 [Acidiphilium sp.]|nr:hypothetical protein [Acidiphilium sp.]